MRLIQRNSAIGRGLSAHRKKTLASEECPSFGSICVPILILSKRLAVRNVDSLFGTNVTTTTEHDRRRVVVAWGQW
jgi:hypothetical protein